MINTEIIATEKTTSTPILFSNPPRNRLFGGRH